MARLKQNACSVTGDPSSQGRPSLASAETVHIIGPNIYRANPVTRFYFPFTFSDTQQEDHYSALGYYSNIQSLFTLIIVALTRTTSPGTPGYALPHKQSDEKRTQAASTP